MDAVTLALLKSMGGGGSSLPSVTSSDNGKVLKVNYGEPNNISFSPNVPAAVAIEVNALTSQYSGRPLTLQEIEHIRNDGGLMVNLMNGTTEVGIMFARVTAVDEYNDVPTISLDTGFGWAFDAGIRLGIYINTSTGDVIVFDNTGGKFIVTLTPTALDYSGTMDKTVAEINAAYEAGQEIWFRLVISASNSVDFRVNAVNNTEYTYKGFSTFSVLAGVQAEITVDPTDDGTTNTYYTALYSLTPAS